MTLDVSVPRGRQKQVTLQFRQLVSVSQSITVVASAPSLLTPDPAQSIIIHDQVLDANPGARARLSRFRGFPSKPHQEESKLRSILLPALPGITASPSRSTFRSAIFSIRTIFLPMLTATAMPIRIS